MTTKLVEQKHPSYRSDKLVIDADTTASRDVNAWHIELAGQNRAWFQLIVLKNSGDRPDRIGVYLTEQEARDLAAFILYGRDENHGN